MMKTAITNELSGFKLLKTTNIIYAMLCIELIIRLKRIERQIMKSKFSMVLLLFILL